MALMKQLLILWLLAAAAVSQGPTDLLTGTDPTATETFTADPNITDQAASTPTTTETIIIMPNTTGATTPIIPSTTEAPTTNPITTDNTASTPTADKTTPAIPIPTATTDQTTKDTPTPVTTMTTTVKPGPCELNPCPPESICEERFNNRTCLCRPGLFYSEELNTCYLARIFPSDLRFNAEFQKDMENPASKVFQATAEEIIKGISAAFSEPEFQSLGYIGSTVLRFREGSVIADVQNFFDVASDVSSKSVSDALSKVTLNGSLTSAIELKDTCSTGYCGISTDCSSNNGLSMCTCKAGYIKSTVTPQECIACPSGKKAVKAEYCEACPFGYSGFDCGENYLLIVVIIATVMGALLLASFVAIIVLGCRKTEKGDTSPDDSDDFTDLEFHKPKGIPRVPRANASSGWQPANLEPADSGDTYALVTKGRPESIAMDRYNDSNSEGVGRYRSHPSSRNEKEYGNENRNPYGSGNGNAYESRNGNAYEYAPTAASSGPRGSRNLYYVPYEDKPRRY